MSLRITLFITLILIEISSCGVKHYTLQNGTTVVPVENKIFSNVSLFTPELLNIIDTTVYYEEFGSKYNGIIHHLTDKEERGYFMFRFYANGRFNEFFIFKRNQDCNYFNPLNSGIRGVYYLKDNLIQFDKFSRISGTGNGRHAYGIKKGHFSFSGDTMFIHNRSPYIEVYIKKKMPIECFKNDANW